MGIIYILIDICMTSTSFVCLKSLQLWLCVSCRCTWYLLDELNGISATFRLLSLRVWTQPDESSTHFNRADSDASPAVSLYKHTEIHNVTNQTTIEHNPSPYYHKYQCTLLFESLRSVIFFKSFWMSWNLLK